MNERVRFSLKRVWGNLPYITLGLCISIVFSILVDKKTTLLCWIEWACVYVGILLFGFLISFFTWKKELK